MDRRPRFRRSHHHAREIRCSYPEPILFRFDWRLPYLRDWTMEVQVWKQPRFHGRLCG